MTCMEMENRLAALIDGSLSEAEREGLEGHLRSCETCRRTLAELRASDALVKLLEEVEPPTWLKTRVMARVREEAQERRGVFRKLFYPLHVKIPIQAMATVLIAVVAWNIYRTDEPEFRQVAPPPVAVQESRNAQTSAAAAPAEEAIREKGPATREKKAFAPPPEALGDQTEKKAGIAREAPAADAAMPARPTETRGYAPLPQKDEEAVRGSGETLRQEPDRAMPAPVMEKKQKALKAPVVSAAKESAKRKAAAPAPPMPSTAVPPRPDIDVILLARDPSSAPAEVEALLKQSGAQSVESRTEEERVILTARIRPESLDALRERLTSVGNVREGAFAAPRPGGLLTIRLEIRPQ